MPLHSVGTFGCGVANVHFLGGFCRAMHLQDNCIPEIDGFTAKIGLYGMIGSDKTIVFKWSITIRYIDNLIGARRLLCAVGPLDLTELQGP